MVHDIYSIKLYCKKFKRPVDIYLAAISRLAHNMAIIISSLFFYCFQVLFFIVINSPIKFFINILAI